MYFQKGKQQSIYIIKIFVIIISLQIKIACNKNNAKSLNKENNLKQNQEYHFEKAVPYLSAKNTPNKLSQLKTLTFKTFSQPDEHFTTLMIDPKKRYQTIEGFGGSLTDAAAETFYLLSEENQKKLLTAYFDAKEGIGYNLFRTHINSCDFSSESYAYAEVDADINLEHFSIVHDLKYRVPFIREVKERVGKNFKLLASPWSPPAWMKTNNHMLNGGKLKTEYYSVWANYYVKFINEYKKQGIPIWGVTVQNEPMASQRWESCIYTADEERDFISKHLGPTLEVSDMSKINIIAWDHNRGIKYQRAQTIFENPKANKYVWGIGIHWYMGDRFDNVRQVKEAFPDKNILFTEGCVYPFNYKKIHEWHWGERYGKSIIHDINNGASGWIDSNLLLNEIGGPNHVSGFCYAPVIANTKTDELLFMNSYYYLGHFSKFIKPGAKRIACTSNNDDLIATAALNTNGTIAIVAMNSTDKNIDFRVWIVGKGIESEIPAHAIITLIIK